MLDKISCDEMKAGELCGLPCTMHLLLQDPAPAVGGGGCSELPLFLARRPAAFSCPFLRARLRQIHHRRRRIEVG